MGDRSQIEWTDATWNPVTGCTKVSPGCDHCYAERLSERFRGVPGHHYEHGFDVTERPKLLEQPLRWRRPRRVFVNSMSDLFHDQIRGAYRDAVFDVMEQATHHCFQVLTKRSGAMLRYVNRRYPSPYSKAPGHIWFGVSVEDRARLVRVAHLRRINTDRRFVSAEPLLEDIAEIDLDGIAWLIAGGESGAGHRPPQAGWIRALRDACARQGTAFMFKQWGGATAKAGGRTLDGAIHDAWPHAMAAHLTQARAQARSRRSEARGPHGRVTVAAIGLPGRGPTPRR